MNKITINTLQQYKGNKKIVMITAYDALFANLFDKSVDIILVGDSLNMSFMNSSDTLSATLEQMIYHTKAVCNGRKNALVVCDMPFGTYNTKDMALNNAVKVYQQSGADAIKIEGGEDRADIVKHLTSNSIAVMGHIGLMPQFVRGEGGYKVKGKNIQEERQLLKDAKALELAGAFAIVVEGVKSNVSAKIALSVDIPVIGIGSGNSVDGQVLVWSDMLGLFENFRPKFVREYLNGADIIRNSIEQYKISVENSSFPNESESY